MKFHLDFSSDTVKFAFFRPIDLSLDRKGRVTGFTIKANSKEEAQIELTSIQNRWNKWIQAYNYWANDVANSDNSVIYSLPVQFKNYGPEAV
jgi:hypothetical protein